MYKSIVIKQSHLESMNCLDGFIGLFNYEFPNGLKISNDQDEMNELFAGFPLYNEEIAQELMWIICEFCDGDGVHRELSHIEDMGAFLSDIILLK